MHDIQIHGNGIVAHAMALSLAQTGLKVALPTANTPRQDARAFAITPSAQALLRRLGAWPVEAASPLRGMRLFCPQVGADASQASRIQARATLGEPNTSATQGLSPLAWMIDGAALYAALQQAVEQTAIARETAAPAALHVICEAGAAPPWLASQLAFETQNYGQTALAGRVQCTQAHGNTACQWFDNGQVLALLPLGASEPGNSAAFVWSLPAELATENARLAPAALAHALTQVSGGVLGDLHLLGPVGAWPLRLKLPDTFIGACTDAAATSTGRRPIAARWLLAGDAAHTVHPLAGLGLNLGLGDVACLARVLGERQAGELWRPVSDRRLLRAYERERRATLFQVSMATDGLQRLFAHTDPRVAAARSAGLQAFDRLGALKAWAIGRAVAV